MTEHGGGGGKLPQMNTVDALRRLRQMLPNLFTGKAQDRRQQTYHRLADAPNRSLGRAAAERVRGVGVEGVLDDVEVEGAEIDHAKVDHAMVDLVESKLLVPVANVASEGPGLAQHVLVKRVELFKRNSVALRIEIVQIAERVLEQFVSDLPVVLRDALHQSFGANYVFAEVDGSSPQAHDLSAEATGDVNRVHIIAARLRHGLAFFVEGPARRDDAAIRRRSARTHGAEQGRLKPSAVLVATFEVEIGGPWIVIVGLGPNQR